VALGGRWYPCCCPVPGYGSSGPGSSALPPLGSSVLGSDFFGQRGSSQLVACGCCAGGVAPLQIQVEVGGVHANVPGLCGACDDYNAAYILTWTNITASNPYCFPPGSSCWWALDFPTICGRSRAHVIIGCGPTAVEVQFSLMPTVCNGPGQWLRWWKTFTTTPGSFNCLFDGLELPYVSTTTDDCTTSAPARLYAV
jgi:hypothetical protein